MISQFSMRENAAAHVHFFPVEFIIFGTDLSEFTHG